jgi:hypothetical protein
MGYHRQITMRPWRTLNSKERAYRVAVWTIGCTLPLAFMAPVLLVHFLVYDIDEMPMFLRAVIFIAAFLATFWLIGFLSMKDDGQR